MSRSTMCSRCIDSDRRLALYRLAQITSSGEQRVRDVLIELFARDLREIRCCAQRVRDEAQALGEPHGIDAERVSALIEIVKRGPWWVEAPALLDAARAVAS